MVKSTVVGTEAVPDAAAIAAKVRAEFEAKIAANAVTIAPETVELTLPGGLVVQMGPPRGGGMLKAVTILGELSARSSGNAAPSGIALGWIKALLYVRALDGTPVQPVGSLIDLQRIADKLGDRGEEAVMTAYVEYWPPFTPDQLSIVKK